MTTADTIGLEPVVSGMRKRARSSRNAAYFFVLVLTGVGIASAFLFLWVTGGPLVTFGEQTALTANASITINADFDWLRQITQAFVRVGAVLMSVFIINILVSISRYNFRVANSLDSRADCLVLAAGNMDQLAGLLAAISLDLIDFTKVPQGPYDKYLDVIRSILPGGSAAKGNGKSDS